MTGGQTQLAGRAEELRRAFDGSFAEARRVQAAQMEDLLAISVGGDPYSVRLAEIAGLFAGRKITPLPSSVPDLIGIAGFRGAIVSVYDLRALLGYRGGGAPRWLVLAAGEAAVGLAFDQFDGHIRVAGEAISPEGRGEAGLGYVREVAQTTEGMRPIIRLSSLLEMIKERARHGVRQKE